MLSWKIRLLILLIIVSPLPTIALVSYEFWAHHHRQITPETQKMEPGVSEADSPSLPLSRLDKQLPTIKESLQPATPNPIATSINKGIRVNITDLTRIDSPGRHRKAAEVNLLTFANDRSGRLFAGTMNGQIYIIKRGVLVPRPFLDVAQIRTPYFYWEGTERGLTSFAFHPDFATPGTKGFRKLYTAHSENQDGIKDNPNTPLFLSPNGRIHHYSVITEWQALTGNSDIVNTASRREILRIQQPYHDHNLGMIAFNPNSTPGSEDFGLLYIAVGDGGNTVKPGERAETDKERMGQNPGTVFGSILRINPLRHDDQPGYQIPVNNPFAARAGFTREIWAYGFRNPQHFSWDTGGIEQMFITDIGQTQIEEINIGGAGANYGWSEREGTFVTDHEDQNRLYRLHNSDIPEIYQYPVAQYDHDEGRAVTGGYVYRGRAIPSLYGKYLFGDIHNGRIFYLDADNVAEKGRTPIHELQLVYRGKEMQLLDIMKLPRADLRFGIDDQHEIYVLTKQDGAVRKLIP